MINHYDNTKLICGCDEAGRGALAGPVVAGAVILPKTFQHSEINDSKKIRNVYSDYKIIPLKWGYGMKNVSKNNEGKKSMKKSSEVLILSHEISKYHEKK